jgi:hypothetical protein
MEDDAYAVHDIIIADRPVFATSGKVEPQRTVSYYIGAHGPFLVQDKPAKLTTALIKTQIEAHQAELRALDTIGTGTGPGL